MILLYHRALKQASVGTKKIPPQYTETGGKMADIITNQSSLDFDLCEEPVTIISNETEANELDLQIIKSQSCDYFVPGSVITYCVDVINNSDVTLENLLWHDTLDPRLLYIWDSFTVDGEPEDPLHYTIILHPELGLPVHIPTLPPMFPDLPVFPEEERLGQRLTWTIDELPARTTVTICFRAEVEV